MNPTAVVFEKIWTIITTNPHLYCDGCKKNSANVQEHSCCFTNLSEIAKAQAPQILLYEISKRELIAVALEPILTSFEQFIRIYTTQAYMDYQSPPPSPRLDDDA
jgi:hypothetical protein